ncbi:3-deoxy-7-phosphoheptulonate synthase [Megasphaera vaginalis (ex Bordigoni et al. 2020)]|uniref:3-deoxy-7-phosphoheptulonate synthase n=1 Tax=Megasphaera vaginalis (ex Bordigoni et al. 2020) TaxID=2045301 RepID=UPI000C79BBC8|nr:3-deoxy-7-phosphoheptulonate synthase [Megasphaera vaginalis (ex Bordigoni et al. 2020)]
MIVLLKAETTEAEMNGLAAYFTAQGLQVERVDRAEGPAFGLIGDTAPVELAALRQYAFIANIIPVAEPFKRASRAFHRKNSVVSVAGIPVGGPAVAVIAGPCSIETPRQIESVAHAVHSSGAAMLRGGAFKPRTSPYAFQGLGDKGLEMLCRASKKEQIPVVTEIMSVDKVAAFLKNDVDLIQVGARNMQNFDLLKALGRTKKPVLLKRGLSATVEEWLMSAEYIMAEGNRNVILCERGIRTFENFTRNTLDLSAVLAVKRLSHLPVIVDPSHAAGKSWMVADLAKAAVAVGADGVMIEVHNDPEHAWCDGAQSVTPAMFAEMMKSLRQVACAVGRRIL